VTNRRIIHISDTHFTDAAATFSSGEWLKYGQIRASGYQNSTLKAQKLLDLILNNQALNSKIVVVTGDLTNDGDQTDYNRWKAFADKLVENGFQVLATPGNHDISENGWLAKHQILGLDHGGRDVNKWMRFVNLVDNNGYPHEVQSDGLHVLLLNSMLDEMVLHGYDQWAEGRLGAAQLGRLSQRLGELQGKRQSGEKVVVALHHNPFLPILEGSDATDIRQLSKLADKQELLTVIASRIDCLLFGHNGPQHLRYNRDAKVDLGDGIAIDAEQVLGIPIINLANLEDMHDGASTEFDVSVVDLETNLVEVYRTGSLSHSVQSGSDQVANYLMPPVSRARLSKYNGTDCGPAIQFQAGDIVTITVGGAVQTGGKGLTWFLYVKPRVRHWLGTSDDSKHLGTIFIPGITRQPQPIRDLLARYQVAHDPQGEVYTLQMTIPALDGIAADDRCLGLGYVDDNYGDNCFDRHDSGEDDECRGVGPAWLRVEIRR
jgi:predicted MPP superfamily phosphohydrolase